MEYNIEKQIEEHLRGCVEDESSLIWVKHKEMIDILCATQQSGY